jgi:hypothetical protein
LGGNAARWILVALEDQEVLVEQARLIEKRLVAKT